MPYAFFECGIALISHENLHTIPTQSGEIEITIEVIPSMFILALTLILFLTLTLILFLTLTPCFEAPQNVELVAQVNDGDKKCISSTTGVLDTVMVPQTPRESGQGPVSLYTSTVYLPETGVYDLCYFGKRLGDSEARLCLQYKMETSRGTLKKHPLIQPTFGSLGLELVSHPYSQVIASEAGELEVCFMIPGTVEAIAQAVDTPTPATNRPHFVVEDATTSHSPMLRGRTLRLILNG